MILTNGWRLVVMSAVWAWLLVFCGCQGMSNHTPPSQDLSQINHIIFMVQENRSADSYFGQLPAYLQANGYPQTFDGLPASASNPGYNGAPFVPAFHLTTECIDNLSPSWNESHLDWNLNDPTSSNATMDGFVYNAANYAINQGGASAGYTDTQGYRAMGYYDWTDLPYYYFMAANFATSDRWFAPALDRTQINRMYLMAATSKGYAYPPGTNQADNAPVNAPTIFDELDTAGISWKIYATDSGCTAPPPSNRRASTGASPSSGGYCTYLTQFAKYASGSLPANVVSASQFLTDADSAQLPSVSFIEPGYLSGQDEHPSSGTNVQAGAAYVATLINGLMVSNSWHDSVFILTYDEPGGLYDHVPPQQMANPDGLSGAAALPIDLASTDVCATSGGADPICNFQYSGFRLPLIVVSPFAKKNYVSHTIADYTAILKLIEARFNVPALTQRDAAQMDMTEFFDFQNVPWATPPTGIPTQPVNTSACTPATLGYPAAR